MGDQEREYGYAPSSGGCDYHSWKGTYVLLDVFRFSVDNKPLFVCRTYRGILVRAQQKEVHCLGCLFNLWCGSRVLQKRTYQWGIDIVKKKKQPKKWEKRLQLRLDSCNGTIHSPHCSECGSTLGARSEELLCVSCNRNLAKEGKMK